MNVAGVGIFCQSLSPTEVPEHEHQEWQISLLSLVTSTQVSWHTATGRQQQKHLSGEQIVITPSGQPHSCRWNTEAELICFFLKPKFIIYAVQDTLVKPVEIIEQYGITDPFVQQLGSALKTECQLSQNVGQLYLESIATVLAVHIIRNYATSKSVLQTHTVANLAKSRLQPAIDYIQENLEQDLNLIQMAAVVHVSPYYFARSFKCSIGLTPHQYLLQCRIERAKLLLGDRNLPVAAIARKVGFQSQSHFTTVFRKLTGVTPSIYRSKI